MILTGNSRRSRSHTDLVLVLVPVLVLVCLEQSFCCLPPESSDLSRTFLKAEEGDQTRFWRFWTYSEPKAAAVLPSSGSSSPDQLELKLIWNHDQVLLGPEESIGSGEPDLAWFYWVSTLALRPEGSGVTGTINEVLDVFILVPEAGSDRPVQLVTY